MRGMSTHVVTIENLQFAYSGTPFRLELDRVELERAEHVALIGPSGSGKSTLLDLIAGIRTPRSGTVHTAGDELSALNQAERRRLRLRQIGFVFQEFRLLEYLNVLESILLPLRLAGVRVDAALRERAHNLAERAGIGALLHRRPDRLSQGERQRAAICRALVGAPLLVLADEPTGNLDPVTGNAVLDLLFEQVSEAGAALLMVTHEHSILPRFHRVIDIGKENRALDSSPGASGT